MADVLARLALRADVLDVTVARPDVDGLPQRDARRGARRARGGGDWRARKGRCRIFVYEKRRLATTDTWPLVGQRRSDGGGEDAIEADHLRGAASSDGPFCGIVERVVDARSSAGL